MQINSLLGIQYVRVSQIDMGDIREAYQEMFDSPLEEGVKKETSGDYRKLLLRYSF